MFWVESECFVHCGTLQLATRIKYCEEESEKKVMATHDEFRVIQAFDCRGDSTSVGPRWRRWRKAFQFYVDGRGITAAARKKALLLHCAGMEVQDIFETLTDPGAPAGQEDDVYKAALRTLDA